MNHKDLDTSFRPLLLGSGRLARHLHRYLELTGCPHLVWEHPRTPPPSEITSQASHFWILVRDEALPGLCASLRADHPQKPLLHSSAATRVPHAVTVHPLMTFGPGLYGLSRYQSIPFILIHEEVEPYPEIPHFLKNTLGNPVHRIPQEDRIRYHAAAVMASNFSMLLWEASLSGTPRDSLPPRESFQPILEQTLANFIEHGSGALTGPLARGDQSVVSAHLEALHASPARGLYRSFVDYFKATRKEGAS